MWTRVRLCYPFPRRHPALKFQEAIAVLVLAPDFKSGGGCGNTSPAGSIPVRFRQPRTCKCCEQARGAAGVRPPL